MSIYTSHSLILIAVALVVCLRAYVLVHTLWGMPLRHGPGFFLGVEVAPGFYDGPGGSWLTRYRTVLVVEHLVEALALAAILSMAHWDLVPNCLGLSAVLFTAVMITFGLAARHALGGNPPVRPAVAVMLKPRRLGDYLCWPMEAFSALLLALSWYLLLRHGGAHVSWQAPLSATWIALGLLPGKVIVVREPSRIPADRPEEHYHWQDAARRYNVRLMDATGWFYVAVIFAYAMLHSWTAARTELWIRWLLVGAVFCVYLAYAAIQIRGDRRLAAMGKGLRPSASWRTPFRKSQWSKPGLVWFAVWFSGILALIFLRN